MSDTPPRIYGLTGGAGSGKSEAAKRFIELGIPVIEADKVGHELLQPGTAVAAAIIAEFGDAILTDGRIDRVKLARVAFANDHARLKLNAVSHPAIIQEIRNRCQTLAKQGHGTIIVEAAIIAEDEKRASGYDGLILVMADETIREDRLVKLRGMTHEQARQRIKAQTPPERKLPLADWVIQNDGTLEQLQDQVDQVANALLYSDVQ